MDNTQRNIVVKLTEFEARFILRLIGALFHNDTLDCIEFQANHLSDQTFIIIKLEDGLKRMEKVQEAKETLDRLLVESREEIAEELRHDETKSDQHRKKKIWITPNAM